MNLFLPQLGRLAAAAGLVVGQAFILAYTREKVRVAREEAEEESDDQEDGGKDGQGSGRRMTPLEAIQILGVEKTNPSLIEKFSAEKTPSNASLEYPVLTSGRDREVARENFERMFGLAVKHQNHFLAGKLSLAFRICVDPNWDDNMGGDNSGTGEEDSAKSEPSKD